jgi:agmatinase
MRDTFANLPAIKPSEMGQPSVVIFGAAEGSPYKPDKPSHSATAPSALRKAALGFAGQLQQFDFDLEQSLFGPNGETWGMADMGDIATDPADAEGNRARIRDATAAILATGAAPVLLGGDDSVPIPWFSGCEGTGSYVVLQIDAHADWGDVIQGNPWGYGSTMRRAAELPWITGMVQVGVRGLGSGGAWQIDDARQWGSKLVTMREIRRHGVAAAVNEIPAGANVLISMDCDGMDPSVLPAVNMPTPGGLVYQDMVELLAGVAAKARIAGLAMVELVPERDPDNLSSLTAARVVATALGHMTGRSAATKAR